VGAGILLTDKLIGVRASDLTYVVSPEVYEKLQNKSNVIFWDYHYPVREDFFGIKEEFRKKDTYTLGYVGSLNPEKGVELILEILRRNKKLRLKIIGGNEKQIELLKSTINGLGLKNRIKLTGFVPQNKLSEELQEIDILVAPFRKTQRTVPLKVYEYLATGIPVVASDIPAVKAVGRDYFFYFESENVDSLMLAISQFISSVDRVNRLLTRSLNYAEKFRWNNVISQILSDIERVM